MSTHLREGGGASVSKQIITAIGVIVFIIFSYYYINHLLDSSEAFNNRMEQTLAGDSSGRDRIAEDIVDYLLNKASFVQLLFGSGARATVKYIGIEAHNDWLEIAMAQGAIGIVLYLLYWFGFYRHWKTMTKDTTERFAFGILLLIYFTKTLFSMSYNDMPIYATCVMGYCLAVTTSK